jgi:3-hydroxyisobutyrate dehydrogenase-like beta-hydroxyacid dehydrogenase
MGGRIARRLLAAGHELSVWNRTPERAAELVDAGARAAGSPAEAARRAEAVITMVSGPGALRAVTHGSSGIAAGVRPGSTVIEMSTVGPAAVAELAATLGERAALLDAPVLGSLTEAESGSLKVFVGGPDRLVERWAPLFRALGSPLHVGPLGAGAAAKLVANGTLFGTLGLLGEALALTDALGLSRWAAYEVLGATPIAGQAERRREVIETGEYPLRFSLALAVKDVDLIAAAAEATGRELRLGSAARSWLADAEAAGWGDRDYAAVLAWILGERASDPD